MSAFLIIYFVSLAANLLFSWIRNCRGAFNAVSDYYDVYKIAIFLAFVPFLNTVIAIANLRRVINND